MTQERIKIIKGDCTGFNGQFLLTLKLNTEILDLSSMKASFSIGSITKMYNDISSGVVYINLTGAETDSLPFGNIFGAFRIYDQNGCRATIETMLPFYVTSTVHGDAIATKPYEYTINVEQGGENILNIDVQLGIGVAVGETVTLPSGSDAYVHNVGTDSRLVLDFGIPKGDQGDQGEQGEPGEDGPAGKDATINGVNALLLNTTYGISLTQSGNTATISGKEITDVVDGISEKIPAQATAQNQLADKNFVNSSIATNTANFIGTFNSVSALEGYSGTVTNNDYAFVINSVITDNGNDWTTFNDLNAYDKTLLTNFDYAWVINGSNFDLYRFDIVNQIWDLRASDIQKSSVTLNTAYNRYKATVENNVVTWEYEYTLNNSSFTANQWEAINSGATQSKIAQITTNQNNIGNLSSLTTTADSDLVSAINEVNSKAGSKVSDVQVNGTSVVNNGVANIPDAQPSGTYGVIKLGTTSNGLAVSSGNLVVFGATTTDIDSKLNSRRPVTPSTLDHSVKVGMTTNTETLTSTEKKSACGWLGALQGVKVNGTALTPDSNNEVDVPLMSSSVFGVAKLGSGLQVGSSGDLKIYQASDAEILAKTNAYKPITPAKLEYATKVGITTNTNTLTSTEKQTATNWILPTQTNEMVLGSDGTDASWDYAVEFIEWSD